MDMDQYNEEEKRLDRDWYNMDEGQDEYHNAFSNISEEYIKQKVNNYQLSMADFRFLQIWFRFDRSKFNFYDTCRMPNLIDNNLMSKLNLNYIRNTLSKHLKT